MQPWIVVLFKTVIASKFEKNWTRLCVLLSYAVYLSVTVWILLSGIRQGLQLSSLLPYDTATFAYLTLYELFFSKFGSSFWLNGTFKMFLAHANVFLRNITGSSDN